MKIFRPLEMDELIWMMYGSVGGVDIQSLATSQNRRIDDDRRDDSKD